MAIKPVQILITAKDKASGVFDLLKKNALALGASLAAYFGARTFLGAIQGAADLEAKLSEVKAVSGATADDMVLLRKAAEDAGASTVFSATDSAEALGNLARAGLSVQESIGALPATLQLAQVGKIALGEAAEVVTRTLAGFSLQVSESARVADVLAKGADASNTSVEGLAQGLSYAAPTAKSLNLSLETTVALLGKFADGGIDASRGGTALNAILSQFQDPASKFRSELAAMGITTNNFESALRQLAAAGPAGQKAILAVGTEAGPALRSLLNQGIGAFDDLKTKLDEAAGSAAATAATMGNNLTGAVRGLGSVWDSVKNALATPVLPVLKDGVEQLTGALREAVADGTVVRFGESIAKGFQAALTWGRAFLSEVDVEAIGAKVSNAATQVGDAFAKLETYATNTGNGIKLAWGVMSAGANTVLGVVYMVGSAFAGVLANIQAGSALMYEALSKVTFGEMSARYKAAADEIALSAGATWAASEALGQKATESLASVADAANTAREGWAGLTDTGAEATSQAAAGKAVFESVAETLKEVGGDATALGQKAQAAAILQTEAARQTREEVARLKTEYEAALKAGDVQGAVSKLQEMQEALRATGDAAANAAQDIAGAFQRMGIETQESLSKAAENARRDFEIIKESGRATTEGLQQAFRQYAEAAIAANGGVANASLQAEAAARGLEITTDAAGKTIVRSMTEAAAATAGVGDSAQQAAQGYNSMARSAEDAAAAVERAAEAERKRRGVDKQGFSADADGNRIVMASELKTLTGITNFLKQAGLDEEQAKKLALEFSDGQGNIPFSENPGQLKYGGRYSSMSTALLKAAEKITFAPPSYAESERKKEEERAASQSASEVSAERGSSDSIGSSRSVSITINTPSGQRRVRTDEEGARALVDSLRIASRAAGH